MFLITDKYQRFNLAVRTAFSVVIPVDTDVFPYPTKNMGQVVVEPSISDRENIQTKSICYTRLGFFTKTEYLLSDMDIQTKLYNSNVFQETQNFLSLGNTLLQEQNDDVLPDATVDKISEICCDNSNYPFHHQVNIFYTFLTDVQKWNCGFSNSMPPLHGEGDTLEKSKQDLDRKFHERFQELYTKCRWERSNEEQQDWNVFESIVDITAYRQLTPLEFVETGKVLSIDQHSDCDNISLEIEWLDGQHENLACPIVDGDTTNFVTDAYYDVKLLRDYQTQQVVKILSVNPSNYRQLTQEEMTQWSQHLPKDMPTNNMWIAVTQEM